MQAYMWLSWEVEGTRKASSLSIRNSRTYQSLKTLAPRMEKSSPCFPAFLVVILLLTPVPHAYIRIPPGVVPLSSLPKVDFSPTHSPWVNTFIPIKKKWPWLCTVKQFSQWLKKIIITLFSPSNQNISSSLWGTLFIRPSISKVVMMITDDYFFYSKIS